MNRALLIFRLLVGVLCLATLLGVGAAFGQEKAPAAPETPFAGNNNLKETTGPVYYESPEGDFVVSFPAGCARMRERRPSPMDEIDRDGPVPFTIHLFCDRQGRQNEGCSVTAFVDDDLDRGIPADSDFVLTRVESILKDYGVKVISQQPYHVVLEDGPRMEGVDVLAAAVEGSGQVWVRGLLVEGDVYILVAWRAAGPLAVDPEIVDFFESFRAHVD